MIGTDGSDVTWTNTHVTAGNVTVIQSGGDTNVKGAVIADNTVQPNVGGSLNLESLQDTSRFERKQKSSGFGVSVRVPPLCYGSSSASVNAAKANASGDYASVTGIDGWLDGTPVQLKIVTGQSISAIQRNVIGAASDMSKDGYDGDVYIDASQNGGEHVHNH